MKNTIKLWWDWLQSLLDIDGDVVLLAFSAVVMWAIVKGVLNTAGAAAYASAVGAFAYSNRGPK